MITVIFNAHSLATLLPPALIPFPLPEREGKYLELSSPPGLEKVSADAIHCYGRRSP